MTVYMQDLSFGQRILDILIRFWLYTVALIADIEKPFLMISVTEEDRDVLRFFESFELLDPEFVKKFQGCIYVDDITFGADNVKETYGLYKKSKTWLAEGGFNLRKFISNSPELRKMIDSEEYLRETPSAARQLQL